MICDEVRALFSDVADARLAPGEKEAWDAHLTTCAECRDEWASFGLTLDLLHSLPRQRASIGFVERVMAAAYPEARFRRIARRRFVPLRLKLPLQAAALVLVVMGAGYLVQRTAELQLAMRDVGPQPYAPPTPPAPGPETAASVETATSRPEPVAPSPGVPKEDALSARAKPRSKGRTDLKKAASETTAGSVQTKAETPQGDASEAIPAPGAQGLEAPPSSRTIEVSRFERELSALRAAVEPAVVGWLAVEDRDTAERALAGLVNQVGATEFGRQAAQVRLVLELNIPRVQYLGFTRGLAGIGSWMPRDRLMPPSLEALFTRIVSTGVVSTDARESAHDQTPLEEPVDTGVLMQVYVIVRSQAR